MKTDLQEKLNKYIFDTRNPKKNFWLGYEYEKQKQYATALSYYLRCAELSDDEDLTYECLLKTWWCFKLNKRRPMLEYGQLLEAIAQSPHRPEAYYFICEWFDTYNGAPYYTTGQEIIRKDEAMAMCYSYACIGIMNISNSKSFLDMSYPGIIGLLFYKGWSAWGRGKAQLSKETFIDLYYNHPLPDMWKNAVKNNLNGIGIETKETIEETSPLKGWDDLCGSCLSTCCDVKEGDWIMGPPNNIEDTHKFVKDYNKKYSANKTWDDFWIGFEEGKKLFPTDKTHWQNPNNYPAFRFKNNSTNSCVNYDDLNKKCSVYDIRPPVCRDFVCDSLAEFKKTNPEKDDIWPSVRYNKELHKNLRYKFKNSKNILKNYSQAYQDMFVLSMLNGKKKGTYLEIGSAEPFYNNNTALLETKFDWEGISIDFNPDLVEDFNTKRNNQALCLNALEIDYKFILDKEYTNNVIDYLQIDCDPPEVTFNILKKIPFDKFNFRVITFEHDYYVDPEWKNKSRKYLQDKGYMLIVSNIAPDNNSSFEDWYIHPDLVDKKIINIMKDTSDSTKKADTDYMLKSNIKKISE